MLHTETERETGGPLIVVIDDEEAVCRGVSRLLAASGYRVATYVRPETFLDESADLEPACILADIRMPELDGITLSHRLRERGVTAPIVFMTATGDVETVVRAMKQTAFDLLPKPFTADALLAAMTRADVLSQQTDHDHRALLALWRLAGRLTPRESEVCALVACGSPNKIVAARLHTTEKTIKVHRGRVMSKLAATSLADLVRIVDRLIAAAAFVSIRVDGMDRPRPRSVDIILSTIDHARTNTAAPLAESPTLVR